MPTLPQPSQVISCTNLASCFQALYNFLFAIFIALAFLNFLYGAFLYLLFGGGIFKKDEGKGRMINSIIAVIVALTIPIILNMINPGIFQVVLQIPTVTAKLPEYTFAPGYLPGTDIFVDPSVIQGTPNCDIPNQGACSLDFLENKMSNYDRKTLKIFSLICQAESGGNPNIESSVDRCQDGNPFSIGLFQINLAASWFTLPDGTVCQPGLIFTDYQSNVYNCRVQDYGLYNKCKEALKNPAINIDVAKRKYNSGGFRHWSVWPIIQSKCLVNYPKQIFSTLINN
jgi:hypothetical protein